MAKGRRPFIVLLGLLLGFLTSPFAQVYLIIDEIPGNTPAGDPLFIAGNFQGWDPGDVNYQFAFDSTQAVHTLTLDSGLGGLEFKFTRGSWATVEGNESGGYIPNRTLPPSDGDTVHFTILGWEDLGGGGSGNSTAADNVSILTDSFYMPQLDRYRRIWIYLPPDYSTSGINYPVLYMHDGQNVFDASTSFSGEWKVDETLNELHSDGDQGIIVVAVDNGGSLRIDEYAAWVNSNYGGGEGEDYIAFIAETLKPYIDQNYRTMTVPEQTGIMGSSLGGLISFYAAVQRPEIFGRIGAFSPAYWFNPELFNFAYQGGVSSSSWIYQIGGTSEGANMVKYMFDMEDTLISSGMSEEQIQSLEHSDGQHSEWYWAREFEDAYLWLFRRGPAGNSEIIEDSSPIKFYPNPSTADGMLQFELPEANKVEVKVLDSLGREVINLPPSVYQKGSHHIKVLEGSSLPSGTYIIQTVIGDQANRLTIVLQ